MASARTWRWVFSWRKSWHCDSKYASNVDLSKMRSGSFLPCLVYPLQFLTTISPRSLHTCLRPFFFPRNPAVLLLTDLVVAIPLFLAISGSSFRPWLSPWGVVMPACSRSLSISWFVFGFICVWVVDRSWHCTKRWSGVKSKGPISLMPWKFVTKSKDSTIFWLSTDGGQLCYAISPGCNSGSCGPRHQWVAKNSLLLRSVPANVHLISIQGTNSLPAMPLAMIEQEDKVEVGIEILEAIDTILYFDCHVSTVPISVVVDSYQDLSYKGWGLQLWLACCTMHFSCCFGVPVVHVGTPVVDLFQTIGWYL